MFSQMLIAIAIVGQTGGTTAGWKPYTSPKGKYTVSLPAKPTEKRRVLAISGKTVDLVTATARKGLATYAASHAELAGAEAEASVEAAQADLLALSKGELKDKKEVRLGDQKGHELAIEIPRKVVAGGANQTARIFTIGGRLYILSATVPTAKVEALADEVTGFFDSFKPQGVNLDVVAEVEPAEAKSIAKAGAAKPEPAKGGQTKANAGTMIGGLAGLNPFGAKPKPPAAEPVGAGDGPKKLGPEWKMFTPAAGGFSAALPGEPKEMKVNGQSPAGPIEVVFYAVERGGEAFIISGHDLPAGADAPARVQLVLDGSKQGMMANLPGAKLVEEKKIEYQGFAGRDLVAEVPAGGKVPAALTIRVRIVIAKGKLIQMQSIRPGIGDDAKAPPELQAYFDSLKIGDAQ